MPRIVRLYRYGDPENLRIADAPSRQPGPSEVRVRVQAASVNRDHFTFMSGRQFSGHSFVQSRLPSQLGFEAEGIVEAKGKGVDRSWTGKRVSTVPGFEENRYRTYGEEAVVPVAFFGEYPSRLATAPAAAFWVPYLTAYGALVSIARIEQRDFVSIPAGSSAVGLAAAQFVRDAGATAITLTRGLTKRAEMLSLGANHVVVREGEDYPRAASAKSPAAKASELPSIPSTDRTWSHSQRPLPRTESSSSTGCFSASCRPSRCIR